MTKPHIYGLRRDAVHARLRILAKAFRGELVPQDPNDEPASVLLERIRKEREAAELTKSQVKTKGRKIIQEAPGDTLEPKVEKKVGGEKKRMELER